MRGRKDERARRRKGERDRGTDERTRGEMAKARNDERTEDEVTPSLPHY